MWFTFTKQVAYDSSCGALVGDSVVWTPVYGVYYILTYCVGTPLLPRTEAKWKEKQLNQGRMLDS